jgi:hypothetical protein
VPIGQPVGKGRFEPPTPAAKQRMTARWEEVRKTLGAPGSQFRPDDELLAKTNARFRPSRPPPPPGKARDIAIEGMAPKPKED